MSLFYRRRRWSSGCGRYYYSYIAEASIIVSGYYHFRRLRELRKMKTIRHCDRNLRMRTCRGQRPRQQIARIVVRIDDTHYSSCTRCFCNIKENILFETNVAAVLCTYRLYRNDIFFLCTRNAMENAFLVLPNTNVFENSIYP